MSDLNLFQITQNEVCEIPVMAAFAELEREMIRERVVAGVKAARANGKTLGRPR